MKTNKIWKLWKEVRGLRRKNKRLTSELEASQWCLKQQVKETQRMYDQLIEARKGTSVFMFAVPQANVFMSRPFPIDLCADSRYAERREQEITDTMKIHLFDELLKNGFIKQREPDNTTIKYEIRVVRG